MQLYSVLHSPYSARVRIQVYAKDLPVEIIEPPGFRTPDYKKLNPTGKVPALVLEDRLLPESSVIMDYLEDRFPDPAMRPTDIDARATMNLFYRFSDSYIQPALARPQGHPPLLQTRWVPLEQKRSYWQTYNRQGRCCALFHGHTHPSIDRAEAPVVLTQ